MFVVQVLIHVFVSHLCISVINYLKENTLPPLFLSEKRVTRRDFYPVLLTTIFTLKTIFWNVSFQLNKKTVDWIFLTTSRPRSINLNLMATVTLEVVSFNFSLMTALEVCKRVSQRCWSMIDVPTTVSSHV